MSIMEPAVVRELLGVPERIVPVAYLTIGYPVTFSDQPLLSEVGWRKRLPLAELIFEDGWGKPASLAADGGGDARQRSFEWSEAVEPSARSEGAAPAKAAPLEA